MSGVTVKAPCKINLGLNIIGKNPDGMHSMDMIMQAVSLYDIIKVSKRNEPGIELSCDYKGVPNDSSNIAWRCAEGFLELIGQQETGIMIDIQKYIPIMAGLGGGSADGAGVLIALNKLLKADVSLDKLCELGGKFGSDIPFCIIGGTARATDIGQVIEPLPDIPDCHIIIAKPYCSVSTKKAFSVFDQMDGQIEHSDIAKLIAGIDNKDLSAITGAMSNAFEKLDSNVMNEISPIKQVMLSNGAMGVIMSGSGSAVFGVFGDYGSASACMDKLGDISEGQFLVKPIGNGPEIIGE